jgi:glycosyltransferase involved in cell wall biosynthesis
MAERQFLLDVSRLIWRVWTRRQMTGIDRVCVAYMNRFGGRAHAVVQRNELRLVFTPEQSDKLFELLRQGNRFFRFKVILLLASVALKRQRLDLARKVYINTGHTGLDAPGLVDWLKKKQVKPVFLVHDLIPITHPKFCRPGEGTRHRARMRSVLDCALGIVFNSADTREAMEEFSASEGKPMPKSVVAWLGIEERPKPARVAARQRPYFLTIGTIEARKNHLMLLRIWERLVAQMGGAAPELVIIGQRGWEADDVFDLLDRSPQLAGHVRELGRCDDATMRATLEGARALLMPSFVEGFGIPVIEALQSGTPVIASDLAVYREFASGIPLYIDAQNGQGWEAAICDFLSDCPERKRQLADMRHFQAPSWDNHFALLEDWLKDLSRTEWSRP